MTRDEASQSSVQHWDAFWRARDKAVTQEDVGSRDPAPAQFWGEFFQQEFARNQRPRLIDVACGNGAVTEIAIDAAKATGTDLTACCVDHSQSAVDEVRNRFPNVEGVACDAREIPHPDQSFDLVVSQFGIEYAGEEAFSEAGRLVAEKGVLAAIVHIDGGEIQKECAENLAVAAAVDDSRLMPLARDAFGAGFDLIAGKISDPEYQEFDKRLAPAVDAVKQILADKGPLAAGGFLARLYKDVGYMYTRMQNYDADEVFAWIDGMSDELVSYRGRMASMTESAINETTIHRIADSLTSLRLGVAPADILSLQKSGSPAAWILTARRGG